MSDNQNNKTGHDKEQEIQCRSVQKILLIKTNENINDVLYILKSWLNYLLQKNLQKYRS